MNSVEIRLNKHAVVENHYNESKVDKNLRQPIIGVVWSDWRIVKNEIYAKV